MKLLALLATALFPILVGAQSVDLDGEKTAGEVRVGYTGSNFSDGRTGQIGTIDATVALPKGFNIEPIVSGGQYFGSDFGGGGLYVGAKDKDAYFRVGGLRNSVTQTTQVWMAEAEGGFVAVRGNRVKAIETDFDYTRRGYNLTPSFGISQYTARGIFYFTRMDLTVRVGALNSSTNGHSNVHPSGGIRARVPVRKRLEFSAFAGFSTEGLTNTAQIASISSRSLGGGAKLWLNRMTSLEAIGYNSKYNNTSSLSSNTYDLSLTRRF
jgi:hypothetical protein